MPTTNPVTSAIPNGYDLRMSPHGMIGLEYAGAQYVIAYEGAEFTVGDEQFHVLKSIDAGVTWTDVATLDVPPSVGAQSVPALTVCQDGSTLYILGCDTQGTSSFGDANCGPLKLWTFDLATDSISGPSTPGSAPTVTKFNNTLGFYPNSHVSIKLVRRGAGDMLFLYTTKETVTAVNYGRMSVASFNGTTFGSPVQLDGQASNAVAYSMGGAACDSSGYLHVVLGETNTSPNRFLVSSMSPGGSFGSLREAEADTQWNASGPLESVSNVLVFDNGGTETVGFIGVGDTVPADGTLYLYHWTAGSTGSSISKEAIAWTAPLAVNSSMGWGLNAGLMVDPVGDLYAFWCVSGSSGDGWDTAAGLGQVRYAVASPPNLSTWSADAQLLATAFGPGPDYYSAAQILVWQGTTAVPIGVFATFSANGDRLEDAYFGSLGAFGAAPTGDCDDPPGGVVGTPYTHSILATGGTPPYSFAITGGALPGGLSMDGSGAITGTPTTPGAFTFEITVTDDDSATDVIECGITIVAALAIDCDSPPDGVVSVAYSHQLAVTGGVPPYTVAIISGALPDGLSMSSAGLITGTPTLAGVFPFEAEATDAALATDSVECSITIAEIPPPVIECDSPPGGAVDVPYSHTLLVTAIGEYTVAITDGALPDGLTMDDQGAITGTPTLAGIYPFTATVTQGEMSDEVDCQIWITCQSGLRNYAY